MRPAHRFFAAALVLAASCTCSAQIVVPATAEPFQPVVASLASPIPDGAQMQGGWSLPTGKFVPCGSGIHIWAPPGKHTLTYRGVWIKTTPLEVNGQTVQVLEGFGFLDETAEFTIGGGPDPKPEPDPTPGGLRAIAFAFQADRLDNYSEGQRLLFTSKVFRDQLQQAGHLVIGVFEAAALDSTAASAGEFAPFAKALKEQQLPAVAIAPKTGGTVKAYPLPANRDELRKLLGDK